MHFQSNGRRRRSFIRWSIFLFTVQHSIAIFTGKWSKAVAGKTKRHQVERHSRALHLRFADDVLLFSTSLEKLREMLCEFKASTEAVGLGIHPDKTKILSNQDKVEAKEITVDNIKIEVLATYYSTKTKDCLRFADDVWFFFTSLEKIREMFCEFKANTEAVGLWIHPDKTKILSKKGQFWQTKRAGLRIHPDETKILSNQDRTKTQELAFDNINIEVLAKNSARYLAQKITFEEQKNWEHQKQTKSSVGRSFHKNRQELASKD